MSAEIQAIPERQGFLSLNCLRRADIVGTKVMATRAAHDLDIYFSLPSSIFLNEVLIESEVANEE